MKRKKAGWDLCGYLKTMAEVEGSIAKKNAENGFDRGGRYFSTNGLYLVEGHQFSQVPLSADELDELAGLIPFRLKFKAKECYMNAGRMAMDIAQLTYCEGVAAGPIPLSHAWVSFKGRPIDVTWAILYGEKPSVSVKKVMARVVHNIKNSVYYGIEVPREYLARHLLESGMYSPYVEGTAYSFEVLKKGLPWRKYEESL